MEVMCFILNHITRKTHVNQHNLAMKVFGRILCFLTAWSPFAFMQPQNRVNWVNVIFEILEPQTTIYGRLSIGRSKSLHGQWLEITNSIHFKLVVWCCLGFSWILRMQTFSSSKLSLRETPGGRLLYLSSRFLAEWRAGKLDGRVLLLNQYIEKKDSSQTHNYCSCSCSCSCSCWENIAWNSMNL